VITHLARNADSLLDLVLWARTGVEIGQYPGQRSRRAGAGASRLAMSGRCETAATGIS